MSIITERLKGADQAPFDNEKFNAACEYIYKDQAVFFLNAYWSEYGEKDCEFVWDVCQIMAELDKEKGADGYALDEFNSHRVLEKIGQTLTVIQFRNLFRKIDQNFDKKMGILEYLIMYYEVQIVELLKRPQGTNQALKDAQRNLKIVQDEINKLEAQKKDLEEKAAGSGIRARIAGNELAQLLAKDPTELNKKILEAEAAVRKAQKSGDTHSQGALWWVERELTEAKKYKPQRSKK